MYQRVGTLSYHRPDALASLAQAYSAQGSHVSTICIRLHDYSIFHRAFEVRAKPAKWAIIPWCKPLPSSSVPVISGEVSTRKKKKKMETLLWVIKYRRKSQKASDIIKTSHPTSNLCRPHWQHRRRPPSFRMRGSIQKSHPHKAKHCSERQGFEKKKGKKSQANI